MQTKSCFVIMPFGEKTDVNGEVIPFDTVYEHILKPAGKKLESHGISVNSVRCDEIERAGWIHSTMIKHIMESDIAIVDVTTANPNVFYELGVRHALKRKVTLLVRRRGTNPSCRSTFKVLTSLSMTCGSTRPTRLSTRSQSLCAEA